MEARGAREAEEVGWGSGSGGNRENRRKPSVETVGKQTKTMKTGEFQEKKKDVLFFS